MTGGDNFRLTAFTSFMTKEMGYVTNNRFRLLFDDIAYLLMSSDLRPPFGHPVSSEPTEDVKNRDASGIPVGPSGTMNGLQFWRYC